MITVCILCEYCVNTVCILSEYYENALNVMNVCTTYEQSHNNEQARRHGTHNLSWHCPTHPHVPWGYLVLNTSGTYGFLRAKRCLEGKLGVFALASCEPGGRLLQRPPGAPTFLEQAALRLIKALATLMEVANRLVDERLRQVLSGAVQPLPKRLPGLALLCWPLALQEPHAPLNLAPDCKVQHVQVGRALGDFEHRQLRCDFCLDSLLRQISSWVVVLEDTERLLADIALLQSRTQPIYTCAVTLHAMIPCGKQHHTTKGPRAQCKCLHESRYDPCHHPSPTHVVRLFCNTGLANIRC